MEAPSFSVANADIGYMLVALRGNTIFKSTLIDSAKKQKLINGNSPEIVFTSDYKNFGWKLYTLSLIHI